MKPRFLLLVLAGLASGCSLINTPLKQYHPVADSTAVLQWRCYQSKEPDKQAKGAASPKHIELEKHGNDCTANKAHSAKHSYRLGFIEFDEFGNLFKPKAVDWLIAALQPPAPGDDASTMRPLLLVVYAHGWRHSAADDDEDVKEFKAALRNITAAATGSDVVGLYLGWRGASTRVPGLEYLSFWDRKSTSHTVGNGAVAEVITRLDNVKHAYNARGAGNTRAEPSKLVLIGHSFGAGVLFTALSPVLQNRLAETAGYENGCPAKDGEPVGEPAKKPVEKPRGIGDLIVLLNPAFEAMRFATLHKIGGKCQFAKDQKPLIAVITADNDWATGWTFPMARGLRALFHKYDTKSNSEEGFWANTRAVGHYEEYLTHEVEYQLAPADSLKEQKPKARNKTWELCNDFEKPDPSMTKAVTITRVPEKIEGLDEQGNKFTLQLTRTGTGTPNNPIANIRVRPPIIDGHGGIYSCELLTLVTALITEPELRF